MRFPNFEKATQYSHTPIIESKLVNEDIEDNGRVRSIVKRVNIDITTEEACSSIPAREQYSLAAHFRAGLQPELVNSMILTPSSPEYNSYYAEQIVKQIDSIQNSNAE